MSPRDIAGTAEEEDVYIYISMCGGVCVSVCVCVSVFNSRSDYNSSFFFFYMLKKWVYGAAWVFFLTGMTTGEPEEDPFEQARKAAEFMAPPAVSDSVWFAST